MHVKLSVTVREETSNDGYIYIYIYACWFFVRCLQIATVYYYYEKSVMEPGESTASPK